MSEIMFRDYFYGKINALLKLIPENDQEYYDYLVVADISNFFDIFNMSNRCMNRIKKMLKFFPQETKNRVKLLKKVIRFVILNALRKSRFNLIIENVPIYAKDIKDDHIFVTSENLWLTLRHYGFAALYVLKFLPDSYAFIFETDDMAREAVKIFHDKIMEDRHIFAQFSPKYVEVPKQMEITSVEEPDHFLYGILFSLFVYFSGLLAVIVYYFV